MHVDLISTTKASTKVIHGSENGKRTACGINLTKPENIGMYTSIGQMTDVVQMTCDKCKTVIAKKLIKEANREMAAQLKEEQKMLKSERKAAKHHGGESSVAAAPPPPPRPIPSSSGSSGGEYVPPSMRRNLVRQKNQAPIETPPPEPPKPTAMPAPNAGLPPIPSAQQPAASDDIMAQFAIPVPGAPQPAAPANNDVLSQFAIPAPGAQQPAAPANNDVLAQFAMPAPGAQQPAAPTAPARPAQAVAPNDFLAQFAIPGPGGAQPAPISAPAPQPVMPTPTPVRNDNDVLSQFDIPEVPTALPNTPAGRPVTADNPEDLLAQFSIPATPSQPAEQPVEDILAQFSEPVPGAPADPLSSVAGSLFGAPDVNAPTVTVSDMPTPRPGSIMPEDVMDVVPTPAPSGMEAFTVPTAPQPSGLDAFTVPSAPSVPSSAPSLDESLDDLLLMPGTAPAPAAAPTIATVPSAPAMPANAPVLNVPEAPVLNVPTAATAAPAPAVPEITNVPTAQPAAQAAPVPALNIPPTPARPIAPPPSMPRPVQPAVKHVDPDTPVPLFVGYSADGRQIFQTYDAMGNPIPITEPVYSAPPEQPKNSPAPQPAPGMTAPVLDMDALMASMGIENPNHPREEGKAINYSEYHMPEKKKRTPARPKPKAAMPSQPEETGPISAAEAKRRKRTEKINRDFEKQLRARGIDPKTGGMLIDPKK